MSPDKPSTPSENKNISIGGDVVDSVVIAGDNNTVNQTFIQKIFNIFKSDTETLEQRNRRILLNHVENAWIKGVLDASLHGAALLDLGIKQDPEAVTKYPWAIKKESTDETLPAGTSMLEIFDSIGFGRSLLILGAPGSGKTTMLLELARGLIARAREDVTQPIPMVFNLASWTEKLTLADWLAQELNKIYYIPRKTAPDWVKGNKLLLLLDGLDEVRQDSRAKCVEAINEFRKQNGLTSLAVCSRSQDYADIKAKLSFEGAIEVQPLTQKQVETYVSYFGEQLPGMRLILHEDTALREMAVTPLFLSVMVFAYRNMQRNEILTSKNLLVQRKYLFGTYTDRMFERPRSKTIGFERNDVFRWLSWLAYNMIEHHQFPYHIEDIQPEWFSTATQGFYKLIIWLICELLCVLIGWLSGRLFIGLFIGLFLGLLGVFTKNQGLTIDFRYHGKFEFTLWKWDREEQALTLFGIEEKRIDQTTFPGERIFVATGNLLTNIFFQGLPFGLSIGVFMVLFGLLRNGTDEFWLDLFKINLIAWTSLISGFVFWLIGGGGLTLIQHISLRLLIAISNILPWRFISFLDHCVDLIFLRRVGGGYIFIHRLLMEHFAEMYVETPK